MITGVTNDTNTITMNPWVGPKYSYFSADFRILIFFSLKFQKLITFPFKDGFGCLVSTSVLR